MVVSCDGALVRLRGAEPGPINQELKRDRGSNPGPHDYEPCALTN